MQNQAIRAYWDIFRGRLSCGSRNVFEFKRHHANTARKLSDGIEVLIAGVHFEISDLTRRRVALWRKCMDTISHAAGSYCEHPAQLAAAEHADG
jgi:hypothetical protein